MRWNFIPKYSVQDNPEHIECQGQDHVLFPPSPRLHTHICQIVFEVSPLQTVLLTVCVCGRGGGGGGGGHESLFQLYFGSLLCNGLCVLVWGMEKKESTSLFLSLGKGKSLCAAQTAIAKGFHLVHVLAELLRYMLFS